MNLCALVEPIKDGEMDGKILRHVNTGRRIVSNLVCCE